MVKLSRGGRRQLPSGRAEPKPLFPPGKLPVFGPPPVNPRGPPPPPPRHRLPYGPGPGMPPRPPPLMRPLPMGPPMAPPPPGPLRGPPPPLMGHHPPPPLMGPHGHGMPPRPPPPFMDRRRRGGGMGGPGLRPWMGPPGPVKRLNKNMKKGKKKNSNSDDRVREGDDDIEESDFSNDADLASGRVENCETFYCETCDRSFKGKEDYSAHVLSHVTCNVANCNFSAHPKVVKLHYKLQHVSGLFSRLRDEKDIKDWIEQRKRNFPTKENIERKLMEKDEATQRGEVLPHQRSNKILGCKRPNFKQKNKRRQKPSRLNKFKQFLMKGRSTLETAVSFIDSLSEQDIVVNNDNDDKREWSDGEWVEESNVNNESVSKPESSQLVNSSLASLMTSYDSDAVLSDKEKVDNKNPESDDDTPEDVKFHKCKVEDKENVSDPVIGKQNSGNSKFKKFKNSSNSSVAAKVPRDDWETISNKMLNLPSAKECTLLERLLSSEIRKERNMLLQCIRYTVDNNFFLPPENKSLQHGKANAENSPDVPQGDLVDCESSSLPSASEIFIGGSQT